MVPTTARAILIRGDNERCTLASCDSTLSHPPIFISFLFVINSTYAILHVCVERNAEVRQKSANARIKPTEVSEVKIRRPTLISYRAHALRGNGKLQSQQYFPTENRFNCLFMLVRLTVFLTQRPVDLFVFDVMLHELYDIAVQWCNYTNWILLSADGIFAVKKRKLKRCYSNQSERVFPIMDKLTYTFSNSLKSSPIISAREICLYFLQINAACLIDTPLTVGLC